MGLAVVGRKRLVEQHHLPVRMLLVERVELARPLEHVVGEPRVRGHHRDELVEHLARALVLHRVAETVRDVADDLPVLAGLARRLHGRAADLHPPVRVRVGADLLECGGRRQHHVCELGRLGQEDVLHDQEVERSQPLSHLVHVGVGQERVLAHHVHALDLAVQCRADDLGDGQPRVRVELRFPGRLELGAGGVTGDPLVVGIHHRDQPRV